MLQFGGMKGSRWYTINVTWQQSGLVSMVNVSDTHFLPHIHTHTHTLMCKDTGSVRKISIKFIATSPHIPSCLPPVDRLLLSSAADRQAVLIHRSSWGTIKVVSTVLHNFLLLRSFIIPFVAHPDFHTLRERNAYNSGGWVTVQKSDLFPDGNA